MSLAFVDVALQTLGTNATLLVAGVPVPPNALFLAFDTYDGEGAGLGVHVGASTQSAVTLLASVRWPAAAALVQRNTWVLVEMQIVPSGRGMTRLSVLLDEGLTLFDQVDISTALPPSFFIAFSARTSASQRDTHAVAGVALNCLRITPPPLIPPIYQGCFREFAPPRRIMSVPLPLLDGAPASVQACKVALLAAQNATPAGAELTLFALRDGACWACASCMFDAAGAAPPEVCPALGGEALMHVWAQMQLYALGPSAPPLLPRSPPPPPPAPGAPPMPPLVPGVAARAFFQPLAGAVTGGAYGAYATVSVAADVADTPDGAGHPCVQLTAAAAAPPVQLGRRRRRLLDAPAPQFGAVELAARANASGACGVLGSDVFTLSAAVWMGGGSGSALSYGLSLSLADASRETPGFVRYVPVAGASGVPVPRNALFLELRAFDDGTGVGARLGRSSGGTLTTLASAVGRWSAARSVLDLYRRAAWVPVRLEVDPLARRASVVVGEAQLFDGVNIGDALPATFFVAAAAATAGGASGDGHYVRAVSLACAPFAAPPARDVGLRGGRLVVAIAVPACAAALLALAALLHRQRASRRLAMRSDASSTSSMADKALMQRSTSTQPDSDVSSMGPGQWLSLSEVLNNRTASSAEVAPSPPPSGAAEIDAADLALGDTIGSGASATVYAGTWRGTRVAIKVWFPVTESAASASTASTGSFPWLRARDSRLPGDGSAQFRSEVALLTQLRHPHVVSVFGVAPPMMLVMELGVRGSLRAVLLGAAASAEGGLVALPWATRARIVAGVAAGVEFLHARSPPIIHRDLKCGNVVMDANLVPKVADFGLSISSPKLLSRPAVAVGTMRYLAPECMVSHGGAVMRVPTAIDVYAFGFILHEVAHIGISARRTADAHDVGRDRAQRSAPDSFEPRTETSNSPNIYQTLSRIRSSFELEVQPHVAPPLKRLILDCCRHEPEARPSFAFLREHLMAVTQEDARPWADGGGAQPPPPPAPPAPPAAA
jgi:serine/threonine protein kinase